MNKSLAILLVSWMGTVATVQSQEVYVQEVKVQPTNYEKAKKIAQSISVVLLGASLGAAAEQAIYTYVPLERSGLRFLARILASLGIGVSQIALEKYSQKPFERLYKDLFAIGVNGAIMGSISWRNQAALFQSLTPWKYMSLLDLLMWASMVAKILELLEKTYKESYGLPTDNGIIIIIDYLRTENYNKSL